MANRIFKQDAMMTLENRVVTLFAKVTIGSSGAPTLSDNTGVKSFVRNSAGNYTMTLSDKYKKFRGLSFTPLLASTTALAAPNPKVVSEDVADDKTIVIEFHDLSTPSATDPGSGEVWHLIVTLSD